MIKRFFAFVMAITFSVSVYAWPEWVMHSPQYDNFIVGVGIGSDRIAARDAAMSEIVAQLSVDYKVEQTQVITSENGHAENKFKQTSSMNSLPFTLEGIEELNFAQSDNEIALLLGINKSTLISNLTNELAVVLRLSNPPLQPSQKFIWALHYGSILDLANKRLRVLNMLGSDTQKLSNRLDFFMLERRQALEAVSCQVIASHELAVVKSALGSSLPQAGDTSLWVKANLKWKNAKRGSQHLAQANLLLTITENQSPFRVLHQRHLVTEGSGSSTEMAKSNAMQKLETQVQTPISNWMFDN